MAEPTIFGFPMGGSAGLDAPFVGIGAGLHPGWSSTLVFGRNDDCDSGIAEPVAPQGALTYWGSGEEEIRLKSTSAQDNPAGSGVGAVFILYLDANWEQQVAPFVVLNGTTEVATGIMARRVLFARAVQAGALAAYDTAIPVGTIDIYMAVPTQVAVRLDPSVGVSAGACYTVPANHTAAIGQIKLQVEGGNNQCSFFLHVRHNEATPAAPFHPIIRFPLSLDLNGDYVIQPNFPANLTFSERTDFWICANAAQNNTRVAAALQVVTRNLGV